MHIPRLSTHADRLERYLGAEKVEAISQQMRDWYGPPIPVSGVPGAVYARKGGDFVGRIEGGGFGCALDFIESRWRNGVKRYLGRQGNTLHSFSSFSDLVAEITAGKKKILGPFNKVGTTGAVGATNSLWNVGGNPSAGGVGGALAGGTALTKASTGALPFVNPTGGDTLHFLSAMLHASVGPNCLLAYDRIWHGAYPFNTSTIQTVTFTPGRYANTVDGTPDSAQGNFAFIEVTTALAATAHNITIQYKDQNNNAAENAAVITGLSACIANRLDDTANRWFVPMNSGDSGIYTITGITNSAAVATGAGNMVLGHPIAYMPIPLANFITGVDGVNGIPNLNRIFDDACIAFLELQKATTTATTYNGSIEVAYG